MTLLQLAAEEGSGASPWGVVVIAALAVATVLLIRNMSARLRRLPPSFPDRATDAERQDPDDRPDPPPA